MNYSGSNGKASSEGDNMGPYRSAKLNKPTIPWNETKLFSVCKLTFPLIRLTYLIVLPAWWVLVAAIYIPFMIIFPILGFIFFGNKNKFLNISHYYNSFGNEYTDFVWPKGFGFNNGPNQIYQSKRVKKFMDRE